MGKSREIFINLCVIYFITSWSQINIYVSGIILGLLFSKIIIKDYKKIFIFLLFISINFIFAEYRTSLGNYALLILYFVSLNNWHEPPKVSHNLLAATVVLNVFIGLNYNNSFQLLNYPNELSQLVPIYFSRFMINTVGMHVLLLYSLYVDRKIFYIIVFLLFVVAGKTTSLLLLFLAIFLKNVSFKRSQIALIIGLSCSVYMLFNTNFAGDYISSRFGALRSLDITDERLIRFPLLLNSISSFLTSPILGLGFLKEEVYYAVELLENPVGHHSHLADGLARFGVFWLYVVWLDLKRYKRPILYVALLGLSLNNVMSFEYFLIPLLIHERKSHTLSPGS